jgi:hypothetical protein
MAKKTARATKEACLCKDGTYSKDCCTDEVIAQGIGSTQNQSNAVITNVNTPRTITSNNG